MHGILLAYVSRCEESSECENAGEKRDQERRGSGEPWRSKNRPPEIDSGERAAEERFVGYRRDVHSGVVCTGSTSGLCGGKERTGGGTGVWSGARDRSEDVAVFSTAG